MDKTSHPEENVVDLVVPTGPSELCGVEAGLTTGREAQIVN